MNRDIAFAGGVSAVYDVILFDLDGTLIDSGEGVTNSVAYSLKKYGIIAKSREELYRFIGPPLHESYQKYFGFSEEQAKEAVTYYREYYRERGIFENRIYEGIQETLETLLDRGKTLLVATSKPELFAREILWHMGLAKYFSYVAGANMDGTRTKKAEVISYARSAAQISGQAAFVMVGDREHDVLGAKEAGIDSVGVLYGYGSREELRRSGADYIIERPNELLRLLFG